MKEAKRKERRKAYENATDAGKAELDSHLSDTGYYWFTALIFFLALIFGILVGGILGTIIIVGVAAFVFLKFPLSMTMWNSFDELQEKRKNPDKF